jgi:hypothetical protein
VNRGDVRRVVFAVLVVVAIVAFVWIVREAADAVMSPQSGYGGQEWP